MNKFMSKTKHLSVLIAALAAVCLTLLFGLTACDWGKGTDEHEHTYAANWSYDETYHWHKCTAENCDQVNDKAEHSFNGQACLVCGYEKQTSSKILDVAGKTFNLVSTQAMWTHYNVTDELRDEVEAEKQTIRDLYRNEYGASTDEELFALLVDVVMDIDPVWLTFSADMPVATFAGFGDPGDLEAIYYQEGNLIYFSSYGRFSHFFADTLYLRGNQLIMNLCLPTPLHTLSIVLTYQYDTESEVYGEPENPPASSIVGKKYQFKDFSIKILGEEYLEPEEIQEMISRIEDSYFGEEWGKISEDFSIVFTNEMQFQMFGFREEPYVADGVYYQDNSLVYIYHPFSDGIGSVNIGKINGKEITLKLSMYFRMMGAPADIEIILEQKVA